MRPYNSGQTSGVANDTNDLVNYAAALSQNTTTANLSLLGGMINDWHKKLLQKYFFNEKSYSIQTVGNQQAYPLPFDYSKLKTGTVTIGSLKWTPTEVLTRQEWDQLNVFPYYADIPSNFYIWSGQFNLWPIPSTGSTSIVYSGLAGTLTVGDTITEGTNTGTILTVDTSNLTIQVAVTLGSTFSAGAFTTSGGATGTIVSATITAGNTITFNYQKRVPDLIFTNYTTSTVSATNGNIHITGAASSWLTAFSPTAGNVLFMNLWIRITAPSGDGEWYQIQSIDSATTLTLVQPYQGNTVAGASYVIGQMPLLLEDFHDLLVAQPLVTYFSTIQPNETKASEFRKKLEEGLTMMDEYVGTKSLNVNLGQKVRQINPNLFQNNIY
jgi:hypothetical protein